MIVSSRLYWLILGFIYAFFVQWIIFPTKLKTSPYPSNFLISCAQTVISYALMQSSLVSHTHIYKLYSSLSFAVKKHYSFHTVKNYSPAQRNATFILH